MPKVRDTRKHKARELLRIATDGPHLFDSHTEVLTREEFAWRYKNWSESWIIPMLKELVPELRKKKPEANADRG